MNMKIIVHAAAEYCIQGDAPPPVFFFPFFALVVTNQRLGILIGFCWLIQD